MKTLLSFALGEALCLFWPLKGDYFCQQNRASLWCQGFIIPEEVSWISGQHSIFPYLWCCDNLCSIDSLHPSWHFTLSAARAWCAAVIPQHFHSCPAILLPMNPESLPSSGEVISIGLCLSQIICVRWSCSMQEFLQKVTAHCCQLRIAAVVNLQILLPIPAPVCQPLGTPCQKFSLLIFLQIFQSKCFIQLHSNIYIQDSCVSY